MKLVFVSTKNLNDRDAVPSISMLGMFKKRKDATKVLDKFSDSHALNTQWRVATFDKGTGRSGGFEYKYVVLDSFENVQPQPVINISELL